MHGRRRILLLLGTLVVTAIVAALLSPRAGPATASGAAAVAAGGSHTCALTTDGGVRCWGDNSYGQLGDGTTTDGPTPVDVVGLGSGIVAIAAGGRHTCALTSAGGVKCWGFNRYGQLGNATTSGTAPNPAPMDVVGLESGVAALALGGVHTCALTTEGGVQCWGWNRYGQLGDGQSCGNLCPSPVNVDGLTSGVAGLAAGDSHTCALTTAGGLDCWGFNSHGQVGADTADLCTDPLLNDRPCSTTPVAVSGLSSGVAAVALGQRHTCAVTAAGGVKCWGDNDSGQLGDGQACGNLCPAPVDVDGLTSGVGAVTGGVEHTCALTAAGEVKCWGDNDVGQLGDGQACGNLCPVPVDVSGLTSGVSAVATGGDHTCAQTAAGGVKCWGLNSHGQLGAETAELCFDSPCSTTPVDVIGLGPKTTPTPCPPEGCPTLTITPTPTDTPTPTPPGRAGDVNCDDTVNSIDAALVLQYGAGLVSTLSCQDVADVNGDGNITSVDAALILQFTAGLLGTLGPSPSDGEVAASLTEFSIILSSETAATGTVTFNVSNDGVIPHTFRVIKTDLAPAALPVDGATFMVAEDEVQVVARSADLDVGETAAVTAALQPSSYVLICNIPTHYEAGMFTAFTVN